MTIKLYYFWRYVKLSFFNSLQFWNTVCIHDFYITSFYYFSIYLKRNNYQIPRCSKASWHMQAHGFTLCSTKPYGSLCFHCPEFQFPSVLQLSVPFEIHQKHCSYLKCAGATLALGCAEWVLHTTHEAEGRFY